MVKMAIEATGLGKNYRDGLIRRRNFRALANVDLGVPKGEIFGLLGPNGAGKTTFIKILLGIIKKTEGNAEVLGHPAGSREARRCIGYLPEQMRIPRHLTGKTALEYYGSLNGMSVKDVRAASPNLLELVGLAERGGDLARKYSKGMVQRLGLAQALLHNPAVLILDEPTDGLDPRARAEMRQVLERLKGEGVTIFLNSHILQEVELICDHVAILHQGQLRYSGSVADIGARLRAKGSETSALRVEMAVEGDPGQIGECFAKCKEVEFEETANEKIVRISVADQGEIDGVVDRLRGQGLSLVRLERQRVTLEDAFLSIISGEQQPVDVEVVQ